ncbi:MAG: ammonia-forming cytochrome c nitrite reductase subunit c552 [Terriglobales bacterium]
MTTNTSFGPRGTSRKSLILATVIAAVLAVVVVALLVTIVERKQEAKSQFVRVAEVSDKIEDPATWGKNFPLEYELYQKTAEMKATKFGGSEPVAQTPTQDDPRKVVTRSKLEQDPRLKIMWAGYAFSKDYRERRGHAYMLEDQTYTGRQKAVKQPGACINCHASTVTLFLQMGDGDMVKGFQKVNPMPYPEVRKLVKHNLACIDCHDPQTMALRITRPAFIEGIKMLKASQGVADYDVNKMASRQEMRTYVCAQCHVEYYFKPPDKQLTYPWSKGTKVEEITAYYEAEKFKDWVHADTGADMLKAQHPEFEVWSQGIHARSGVTCADCHMPFKREGAMKVSDHHVQSPLLVINRSCQNCHHWEEKELKTRVETIQTRFFNLKNIAMDAAVDLAADIKSAKEAGATDTELAVARGLQRKASFYIDFVMSDNSMGFHAPDEEARVLGEAINFCRQGQLSLRSLNRTATAPALQTTSAAVPGK